MEDDTPVARTSEKHTTLTPLEEAAIVALRVQDAVWS